MSSTNLNSGRGQVYRKVIRIRAEDSPNVQLGLAEELAGIKPSHRLLLPGVLPYDEYKKRRKVWDPVKQCIGLDGLFYQGSEILLYPPLWLDRAEDIAAELDRKIQRHKRQAEYIAIDTAEGGDDTAWSAVDKYGLIDLEWDKTPDTNVIPGRTINFMRKHGLHNNPRHVIFDAGGGGKVHADAMRGMGYNVRTVAFGEPPTQPIRPGKKLVKERIDEREERYTYVNKRAEMYGTLRLVLEPKEGEIGFGIPEEYVELRKELAPIPLMYDREGRLRLPPKKRLNPASNQGERSLVDLIGHSPDKADALVMAVYLMIVKPQRRRARAMKS